MSVRVSFAKWNNGHERYPAGRRTCQDYTSEENRVMLLAEFEYIALCLILNSACKTDPTKRHATQQHARSTWILGRLANLRMLYSNSSVNNTKLPYLSRICLFSARLRKLLVASVGWASTTTFQWMRLLHL